MIYDILRKGIGHRINTRSVTFSVKFYIPAWIENTRCPLSFNVDILFFSFMEQLNIPGVNLIDRNTGRYQLIIRDLVNPIGVNRNAEILLIVIYPFVVELLRKQKAAMQHQNR